MAASERPKPEARAACYDSDRIGPLIELAGPGTMRAVIAPKLGGQLVGLSLRRGAVERELLFRGMDFCRHDGWGGKAPILWPATGRNFTSAAPGGQGWMWRGKVYPLNTHGFARDLPWRVVRTGTGRNLFAELELGDTPQTRASYPFGFRFTITYRLSGSRLVTEHRIVAEPGNDGAMPFSIGNHITFKQPLVDGPAMRVSTPAHGQLLLDGGKPTGETARLPLVAVPADSFGREVAVSLTRYRGVPTLRLDDASGIGLTLSHRASRQPNGVPVQFNLWGNAALGFFSPEPWLGRQNSLVDGQGLIELAPGRTFRWDIDLRVMDHRR